MSNPTPYLGPIGDDDDTVRDDSARDDGDGILDPVLDDDDRPLDPDLDDDQLDSAAADERAATEGTLDVDDRP
ncbi:hypothetical protein [Microbacterium sp. B35-30]|uniref:hypothetical protein n=1 Tax=Microbacterium sp. B35-30 TaxID=1962642 RepID=UPI0013D25DDA|nr:hypothetical protein [Microbacterium sp. B35-30]KAF2417852.1 hypothetical protein B2K11_10725 [Microbacterium sp. B35-30]